MVSKKLTVVQVVPEMEEGGVEGETLDFAVYLARQGHTSFVISGGGRLVEQLEQGGVKHLCWPHIGEKSLRCLKYRRKLRKFFIDEQVDIVHLRSRLPAWLGYLAWKSIPREKRPGLVTSFHGFYSINSYSTIMTKGEKVIAVSETIRDHIFKHYPVHSDKVEMIHGGFDVRTFDPDQVEQERVLRLREKWKITHSDKPIIMLPGRLTRWKGQDVFIEAMSQVKDISCLALLVGDKEDNPAFTKRLQEKIDNYNLQDKVKLVGHCSDMAAAMLIADVVVSASSTQPEAFGKVAIEAMAMGKPVIATRHGGSLETVRDGETGWLVEPKNSSDLAQALREVLQDPEKIKVAGEIGKKRVNETFTACIMCEKTLSLYESLLEDKRKKKLKQKLTVLQLLPELEGGGVERGTLEMGCYLAKMGHRSLVISGGGRMVKQLEAEGSVHIGWKIGEKTPNALRYIWPLRQLMIEEQVDVLHMRSRMPAWIGYVAWNSIPKNRRPALVTTFHGFYSINSYSAIMTKGMCVIAVSEGIQAHIKQHYGVEDKVTLIYRGVDDQVFDSEKIENRRISKLRKEWGLSSQSPVIMLPGRLTRLKGQTVFLESLSLLNEMDFQAILVGDVESNPGYYEELKERIAQYNLDEKVKFVGHCADMPAAFLLADLVVSATSSEPEAFGRTTVEAMAMSKPVIATAHGGSLETVLDNETGWFVPPLDAKAMATTIKIALLDKQKRAQFGKSGQQRVKKYFTLESMCRKTLQVYRDLLH